MNVTRPTPAHFGFFVYDLDRMVDFYTRVFKLTITDEGLGKNFGNRLVFMSASEDQHHQLVLSAGRSKDSPVSTVMQLSFKVEAIDDLRRVRAAALAEGATQMRGMNHGNALSIYFFDIEDNTVEVYLDTPWYVTQPHGDPLDLDHSDADIWAETERIAKADPTFMPLAEWAARFEARQRAR